MPPAAGPRGQPVADLGALRAPSEAASARSSRAAGRRRASTIANGARDRRAIDVVALEQVGPRVGLAVGRGHPGPAGDLRVLAGGHERREVGVPPRAQRGVAVDERLGGGTARSGRPSPRHYGAARHDRCRMGSTVPDPRSASACACSARSSVRRRASDPAARASARPRGGRRARAARARRARRRSRRARACRRLRSRRAARSRPSRWASSASTSSPMPVGGATEETATTAVSLGAERAQRGAQVGQRARGHRPRSALVTTSTSGTSMIPALRNCSTSPEPGWTTTATVSATSATSVSDWPTPTVSITTTSNAAGQRAGGGAGRRGEAAEPVAGGGRADEDGRGRAGSRSIRARSPSSDPPERREARVDRQHRHRAVPGAPLGHQPREQRGLAHARRPGDADDLGAGLGAERGRGDARPAAPRSARAPRGAALDQVEDRRGGAQVPLAQARAEFELRSALRSRVASGVKPRGRRRRRRGARRPARRCRASSG